MEIDGGFLPISRGPQSVACQNSWNQAAFIQAALVKQRLQFIRLR
jgi:hypothetical protein